MNDQTASEAGRIIELRTEQGVDYHEKEYSIQPFGTSSFIVEPRRDQGFWFIVPTRVVYCITMGRAKDVNEQDSNEAEIEPGELQQAAPAAPGVRRKPARGKGASRGLPTVQTSKSWRDRSFSG